MSERSYCPSAKRDALSNKLQTANREPCDSLRRGLCSGLSFYPRSRLSDHIKNLQRFPDTLGGMKSSLATRKLAVEVNAGCRGVVPAGGLSLNHSSWVPSHSRFFLPIPVLRKVFRRKFVIALSNARHTRDLRSGVSASAAPSVGAYLRAAIRGCQLQISARAIPEGRAAQNLEGDR